MSRKLLVLICLRDVLCLTSLPANGKLRALYNRMEPNSLPGESNLNSVEHSEERRKNARFAMRFPIFIRGMGDTWATSETSDVSASGTFFVSDRPFQLNAPLEYVLIFPQELTKAARPLLVRFFGMVIRSEIVSSDARHYGIAVRNTAHRYIRGEEESTFDGIQQMLTQGTQSKARR